MHRVAVRSHEVRRQLVLLAAVALLRIAPLAAQATTGTIEGVVTGRDGDSPGAHVEIRDRSTGVLRRVEADRRGRFRALALAPGRYDVTARALGYTPQARADVPVLLGERTTVDFALERGAVELEPTVITAARGADVARTDVATAVTTDEIARLPLNSRNLLDVAVVAPGVRSYAVEGGRSLPAAGALSAARFVNLYIDGVEWKGVSTGNLVSAPQSGSLVSQDAIREFRVLLNPYDVEFTRGASWVISAVTHQGGNELHGSLFDFGQNRTLVAKSAFQTVKPDYRRQQAGGTLRGPLVRDHLFFAASYEGQSTDNFIDVVPGRPAANPALWDRYAGTFRAPFRNRMYTLRLTAPLGRHTLDASWVGRDLSTESGFGVPSGTSMLGHDAAIVGLYRARSVLLRDTWANAALAHDLT